MLAADKPVAVFLTFAAVTTALGAFAFWPARSAGTADSGHGSEVGQSKAGTEENKKENKSAKKKNVLRLVPDNTEPETPKKGIIKHKPSAPLLSASQSSSGDKDKWLAYNHENDSHPPAEPGGISYAHKGDDYQGDKHDTNRDPTLGDSWSVLPSPSASGVLRSSKSNPKLSKPRSGANLRPPPAASTNPTPPVPVVPPAVSPIARE